MSGLGQGLRHSSISAVCGTGRLWGCLCRRKVGSHRGCESGRGWCQATWTALRQLPAQALWGLVHLSLSLTPTGHRTQEWLLPFLALGCCSCCCCGTPALVSEHDPPGPQTLLRWSRARGAASLSQPLPPVREWGTAPGSKIPLPGCELPCRPGRQGPGWSPAVVQPWGDMGGYVLPAVETWVVVSGGDTLRSRAGSGRAPEEWDIAEGDARRAPEARAAGGSRAVWHPGQPDLPRRSCLGRERRCGPTPRVRPPAPGRTATERRRPARPTSRSPAARGDAGPRAEPAGGRGGPAGERARLDPAGRRWGRGRALRPPARPGAGD